MYQKVCHVAMKHDKPVNGDAKSETQTVNATFAKKSDFDLKVSLVEETFPNDSNVWNHWTGNGNSGIDAVAHANKIDRTATASDRRKELERVNLPCT